MDERQQRRHSATALHFALSTGTGSEETDSTVHFVVATIGRVHAKDLHRQEIMILAP